MSVLTAIPAQKKDKVKKFPQPKLLKSFRVAIIQKK